MPATQSTFVSAGRNPDSYSSTLHATFSHSAVRSCVHTALLFRVPSHPAANSRPKNDSRGKCSVPNALK